MGEKEKVTIMVLKVNLQCHKCYKKVKKVLCKFPQIRDQKYDEKQSQVVIKVVCCNPEKIRDKICCKGGCAIKCIEIKEPEKCKPLAPPMKPLPEPPVQPSPPEPPVKPPPPEPPVQPPPPKPPVQPPPPEPPVQPLPPPAPPVKPCLPPAPPVKPCPPPTPPVKPCPPPTPPVKPCPPPMQPVPCVPEFRPPVRTCCTNCYHGHAGGPCHNGYGGGQPRLSQFLVCQGTDHLSERVVWIVTRGVQVGRATVVMAGAQPCLSRFLVSQGTDRLSERVVWIVTKGVKVGRATMVLAGGQPRTSSMMVTMGVLCMIVTVVAAWGTVLPALTISVKKIPQLAESCKSLIILLDHDIFFNLMIIF